MIRPSPADTAALLGIDLNGIMWCDLTLNPGLYGCAKVSPACTNCYAEEMAASIVRRGRSPKAPALRDVAARYASGLTEDGRWTGRVVVDEEQIGPAFDKLPKKAGTKIRRVFVTSMSDLFHKDVPFDFLDAVFAEMEARPWIDFLVLTKRADRMAEYAAGRGPVRAALSVDVWPANVWAGTTVEDQRRVDERIPWLLQVPAAVRFLSVEPMLSGIDIDRYLSRTDLGFCTCILCNGTGLRNRIAGDLGSGRPGDPPCPDCHTGEVGGIGWVIVGSESNGSRPGARETDPAWVLDLVKQCDAAQVPVFVKQLAIDGRLCTLPEVNGRVRAEFPEVSRA